MHVIVVVVIIIDVATSSLCQTDRTLEIVIIAVGMERKVSAVMVVDQPRIMDIAFQWEIRFEESE